MKITKLPVLETKSELPTFEEQNVTFTDAAKDAFFDLWEDGAVLRFGVKGGGCSGALFNLEFIKPEDIDAEEDMKFILVHKDKELPMVMDIFSAQYLKGTSVDHIKTLKETGFKFESPLATRSCGCGKSFAV